MDLWDARVQALATYLLTTRVLEPLVASIIVIQY
jgi:hypothetical protein